jgi:hypothetical protein
MKLCCVKTKENGALTLKKQYRVVAISFNLHNKTLRYNILDDFTRLAFYEEDYFEVVDNGVDQDWVLKKKSKDFYILLPQLLAYDTFYEDYHNDDEEAIKKFKTRYPSYGKR